MTVRLISSIAVFLGLAGAPVFADVTHHYSGRFGVSYTADPNAPDGGMQALYEGSFTTRFSHETDGGVRFHFDIGVVMSNFESARPANWPTAFDRR